MNSKITEDKTVLSCKNLTVGYRQKVVLKELNLTFGAGHFISLLGPNGAGKTTLLRTLSRHRSPLGGEIHLMGMPLQTITAMTLAKTMAVVLTDKVSPPLLTVFEFVALGRYPHTDFLGRLAPQDQEVVTDALKAVHAQELARRSFSDLSDGERQKALVARALAQQPKLLLLDEPTNHLDLKHRVEVMTILRNLCRSQGITVVASLHDVDVAAKVSDRVALIKGGRVVDWGPPETVLTGRSVSNLYDFDGADFDRHLGGIEMRGDGRRGRAFVLAGMGSGALVYRMLAKQGIAFATGVLHSNDLDYYVARSLGAACTVQSPMEGIGGQAVIQAKACLDQCDVVIDCGFEVGKMNQGNMELLESAFEKKKPILSLRSTPTIPLAGKEKQNYKTKPMGIEPDPPPVIHCNDISHLLQALDNGVLPFNREHASAPSETAS